jgi:hypothetical protein
MNAPGRPDGRRPPEEFRDVPRFPGYRVSSLGRVQSRRLPGRTERQRDDWADLRLRRLADGRLTVRLCSGGRGYVRFVHEVVLEAFIGPCPEGHVCRFADGDPSNARLVNLRWEAGEERRKPGRFAGSKHPRSKLTEEAVKEMCRLRAGGMSLKEIADRFGVSEQHVSGILRGLYWKHVTQPRRATP